MYYKIKASKGFKTEINWHDIIKTILSPKKSIISNNYVITYFKTFKGYALEANIKKYENTLYVFGAKKNAILPTM